MADNYRPLFHKGTGEYVREPISRAALPRNVRIERVANLRRQRTIQRTMASSEVKLTSKATGRDFQAKEAAKFNEATGQQARLKKQASVSKMNMARAKLAADNAATFGDFRTAAQRSARVTPKAGSRFSGSGSGGVGGAGGGGGTPKSAGAGTPRTANFVIKFLINTGPVKQAIALMERLNMKMAVTSGLLTRIGNMSGAVFSFMGSAARAVGGVFSATSAAMSRMLERVRVELVRTRFEVAAMGALVSYAVIQATMLGSKAALDSIENLNQFNVSFGNAADQAMGKVNQMSEELNMSRFELIKYMASTQDLLTGFGMGTTEALNMSEAIVKLGLDLASFKNMDPSEAIQNTSSALMGNAKALRSYDVAMTSQALAQKAMQMGFKKSFAQLTNLEKVMVRFAVITEQSKNALGDMARTKMTPANVFKALPGFLKDMSTDIFGKSTENWGKAAFALEEFIRNNSALFRDLGRYMDFFSKGIVKVTEKVLDFVSAWKELSSAEKDLTSFVSAVVVWSAPLIGIIVIFGRALKVTSIWTLLVVTLALAIQDVVAVMKGGNGYFKDFLDSMGLTVSDVKKMWEDLKKSVGSFFRELVSSGVLQEMFKDTLDFGIELVKLVKDELIPAFRNWLADVDIKTLLHGVLDVIEFIGEMILWITSLLVDFYNKDEKKLAEHFERMKEHFHLFAQGVIKMMSPLFALLVEPLADLLWNVLVIVAGRIPGLFGEVIANSISALREAKEDDEARMRGRWANLGNTLLGPNTFTNPYGITLSPSTSDPLKGTGGTDASIIGALVGKDASGKYQVIPGGGGSSQINSNNNTTINVYEAKDAKATGDEIVKRWESILSGANDDAGYVTD